MSRESKATKQLWEALHSGAAPLATRMGLTPYEGGLLKLAFADQHAADSPAHFRAAVMLTATNAYELWKLLGDTAAVKSRNP